MGKEMGSSEHTNFRHDTGEDNLFLSCCFDGGAEIGVVPCVDLALTVNK